MAAPIYKTKGELRSELLIALGYGGLGSAAGAFVPRANYLLEQAQENLYRLLPDEKRIREWLLTTGIGQQYYDFPADCDPDRIREISVYFEQTWLKLKRGIDLAHDSVASYINYYPQRYDIKSVVYDTNLQINPDMSIEDTTATGSGLSGWTWGASQCEITSGKLRTLLGVSTAFSSFAPVIGRTYDIAYTIENVAVAGIVQFGGASVDINGQPLGKTIGSHSHRVTAITANGLGITSAAGTWLDDVSITDIDAREIKPQLEFWPLDNNRTYPWRIEGFIQLAPFVADSDRATVDDRLILLHAEAFGKAHLNKPDAGVVMQELRQRLKMLRGEQHGEQRYIRGEKEEKVLPWPQVIT